MLKVEIQIQKRTEKTAD